MSVFGNYAVEPVEIQLCHDGRQRPEEFTDEDAAMLSQFRSLRWIVVQDTSMTDRGLERLTSVTSLQRLDVEGSRVTVEGVARFRAARPDVSIYYAFE